MKYIERFAPAVLVLASVVVAVGFVYLASIRTLTSLENVFFQAFTLGVGFVGSYIFGRQSAKAAAREMIEPHARSAFRRLISLFNGLSRVARVTAGPESNEMKLKVIEAIVVEQISTADDALEDWRDVVPDTVAELKREIDRLPEVRKD